MYTLYTHPVSWESIMFMDGSPQLCDEDAAVHQTTNVVQMTSTQDKEGFIYDVFMNMALSWHDIWLTTARVATSFNLLI